MTGKDQLSQRYAIASWILISFLTFVGLPTLLGGTYYMFVQSDTYSSEAKVAPRNREDTNRLVGSGLSSLMSQIGGANLGDLERDAYAIRDYITSREIIIDLGGADKITDWLAATDIDFFSQYTIKNDIDRAWEFWVRHVTAYVDSESGLIRIRVNAYSPEAAKILLDRILLNAEAMLNEASMRAREYNVEAAQDDFQRSLEKLGVAQNRLLEFQIANSIVNPIDMISEITEIIGTLRLRRAELQANIDSYIIAGTSFAPRDAQRIAQIQSIDRQIANFEADLTGVGLENGKSLAIMLEEYEPLRVDLEFRNRMYELDSAAFEKARNEAIHQQKYLMLVVSPVQPDHSSQHSSLASSFFLFAALTICWGTIVLLIAALRDA